MCGEMQNTDLLTLANKMRKSASETRDEAYTRMFLVAATELEARASQLSLIPPGARPLDMAC